MLDGLSWRCRHHGDRADASAAGDESCTACTIVAGSVIHQRCLPGICGTDAQVNVLSQVAAVVSSTFYSIWNLFSGFLIPQVSQCSGICFASSTWLVTSACTGGSWLLCGACHQHRCRALLMTTLSSYWYQQLLSA